MALVLGNEEHGLEPEVAAACEQLVQIPGSGAVESLNVSAAAAVLCWEYFGGGRTPAQRASAAGAGNRTAGGGLRAGRTAG